MSQNSSDNKVGSSTNTDALSIEKSSSGQYLSFNDQTDSFGYFNEAGLPEGVIATDIGSICIDTSLGFVNIKQTDTANTGWIQLPTFGGVNSWTPIVFGTSVAGLGTYTTQNGSWIGLNKNGGSIFMASAQIVWTAHTGSGNMRLSLPNFDAGTPRDISGSIATSNIAWPANVTQIYMIPVGSGQADVIGIGAGIAEAAVALTATGTLRFTLWYRNA